MIPFEWEQVASEFRIEGSWYPGRRGRVPVRPGTPEWLATGNTIELDIT